MQVTNLAKLAGQAGKEVVQPGAGTRWSPWMHNLRSTRILGERVLRTTQLLSPEREAGLLPRPADGPRGLGLGAGARLVAVPLVAREHPLEMQENNDQDDIEDQQLP